MGSVGAARSQESGYRRYVCLLTHQVSLSIDILRISYQSTNFTVYSQRDAAMKGLDSFLCLDTKFVKVVGDQENNSHFSRLRCLPHRVCGILRTGFVVSSAQRLRYPLHRVCGIIRTGCAVGIVRTAFAVSSAQGLRYRPHRLLVESSHRMGLCGRHRDRGVF